MGEMIWEKLAGNWKPIKMSSFNWVRALEGRRPTRAPHPRLSDSHYPSIVLSSICSPHFPRLPPLSPYDAYSLIHVIALWIESRDKSLIIRWDIKRRPLGLSASQVAALVSSAALLLRARQWRQQLGGGNQGWSRETGCVAQAVKSFNSVSWKNWRWFFMHVKWKIWIYKTVCSIRVCSGVYLTLAIGYWLNEDGSDHRPQSA